MSIADNEPQISLFLPFFYPSSQSTTPDSTSAAASLANYIKAKPIATAWLATDLPTFLLHIATVHPAHTDHVLQTAQILTKTPSLPLINNWDSSRPNATFEEMFHVAFGDDVVNNAIREPDVEERESYIAASLLGSRARSIGILDTPEVVGSLAEGLAFSDEVQRSYQGNAAEIAAIGACIQLLGGASPLVPKRFAKDKIMAALDDLQISHSQIDMLIQFTKSHLEKKPLIDLTSEEIVDGLKAAGWRFPGDRY